MEMHQIRYFLTLARTLNFSRAAEECNVTQPALTRAIKMLEAELGGELLRRERNHSHLTELGQRILPLMARCYETAESAVSLAHSVNTGCIAPLSIAVSHTVNLALLKAPLAELSAAHPGILLRVKRGSDPNIARMLKGGEVELGIAGPLAETWDRFDAWPLFAEPFELAVNRAHRLAGRNSIAIADLAGETLLVQDGDDAAAEIGRGLGAGASADCFARHEVDSDADLVTLLEAGLGAALVPASAPQSPALWRVPVTGLNFRRTVTAYAVAGRKRSASVAAFMNLLHGLGCRQRAA